MKYIVKSNFDNGKPYKVGQQYSGSDAESLFDQGLLVKSESPEGKRLSLEAEISGKSPAPEAGEKKEDAPPADDKKPEETKAPKAPKKK